MFRARRSGSNRARALALGGLTTLTLALGAGTASADYAGASADSGTHFTQDGKDYTFEFFTSSGASGENPGGASAITEITGGEYNFAGALYGVVRCLRVAGNQAVIGLQGSLPGGTISPSGTSYYIFAEDNGSFGATPDRIEFILAPVAPTQGSCPAPKRPANPLTPYTAPPGSLLAFNSFAGGDIFIQDDQPVVINADTDGDGIADSVDQCPTQPGPGPSGCPVPTPPTRPTSADQCKKDGWRSYGTLFKNQGDCVSFVATGGKNQPAGT